MTWTMSLAAMRQLLPLRRHKAPAPKVASQAYLAAMRERERRDEQIYFVEAMRRLSRADPNLRSHLYIISLKDFRDAVAAKWLRLSDKVAMLTRTIIARHLGKGDLFAQADDETFVLAMPTLGRQQARQRVVSIAQDLSDRLLGDGTVAGRRPEALAANIPFSAAVRADGSFDMTAIRQEVDRTRPVISAAPRDEKGEASGVVVRWHLDTLMRGAERVSVGMPMPPEVANDSPAPQRRPAAQPLGWRAMASDQTRVAREWKCFQANAPPHDDDGDLDGVSPALPEGATLSLMWRPSWVAAEEAISLYQARVVRIDHPGAAPLEGSAAYPGRIGTSGLVLDRFVVASSVAALRAAESAGRRAKLLIPLCWKSLDPAARWSLLGPICDLPSALRHDRIKIELFRIPHDVDEAEVDHTLSFIRGLGIEPVIRLRPSSAPIGLVARAGAQVITLDLAELGPDEQMGDDDLLTNLQRFQLSASRRHMGCALWGARRRRVVVGLVLGGYRMVNGPGLACDLARLGCVLSTPREQFADVG